MAKIIKGGGSKQRLRRFHELFYAVDLEFNQLPPACALGVLDLNWHNSSNCAQAIVRFLDRRETVDARSKFSAPSDVDELWDYTLRIFEDVADFMIDLGRPKAVFDLPALDIAERVACRILNSAGYRLRSDHASQEWKLKINRLAAWTDWSTSKPIQEPSRHVRQLLEKLWKVDAHLDVDAFSDVRDHYKNKLPLQLREELDW